MRTIKIIGLAVVAVLALSAVTASGAFAEEFIASKEGNLKGKALNTQKFKTGSGATVECTKAEPTGKVTKLKATEQEISVKYSSCSVLTFGEASVSLADYTFFVPGLVSILNASGSPIIILAKGLGVECEVEVKGGQMLGSATEIKYVNKSGKIELQSKVTKIESKILKSTSTSLCGKA